MGLVCSSLIFCKNEEDWQVWIRGKVKYICNSDSDTAFVPNTNTFSAATTLKRQQNSSWSQNYRTIFLGQLLKFAVRNYILYHWLRLGKKEFNISHFIWLCDVTLCDLHYKYHLQLNTFFSCSNSGMNCYSMWLTFYISFAAKHLNFLYIYSIWLTLQVKFVAIIPSFLVATLASIYILCDWHYKYHLQLNTLIYCSNFGMYCDSKCDWNYMYQSQL